MAASMATWRFYIPRGTEIVLIILLGWIAASWWFQNAETEVLVKPLAQTTKAKSNAYKSISKVALFGEQKNTIAHVATSPKIMAKSNLKVKLLGTVVAGDRSAAVMSVGKSAETTFFLGDHLQAGVSLKAVKVDAVIIDHQGKLERISLSKKKIIFKAKASQANRPLLGKEKTPRYKSR